MNAELFQDPRVLVVAASVFGLVLSIWVILVIAWAMRRDTRSQELHHRLGGGGGGRPEEERVLRLWREGEQITTTVRHAPDRMPLMQRLRRLPREAGWSAPIHSVLLGLGGVSIMGALAAFVLTHNLLAALGTGGIVIAGFWIYLQFRIGQETARFEAQLVDALQVVARSLRAGHPVLGAFQLVAEEMEEPVKTAFQEICQQQALGMSLEEAIRSAAEETSSRDFRFFAAAIAIALRSGGNLADMMDRMAFVIRERIRLGARVRVLTSQARFSKNVLIVLPFAIGTLLYVINAEYTGMLFTTAPGRVMVAIGLLSISFGALVMNRMVRIRY